MRTQGPHPASRVPFVHVCSHMFVAVRDMQFARYGALVVGVGYGAWRAQHLRSVEAHAREADAHAAEIKAHKQAAAAAAAPHTGGPCLA